MPRLNPDALTVGTFTSSYPPVAQVIESAQALEALGFDHVWSGDQLQFQITCGTLPLLLCHPDREQAMRWLDHPFMQWHALTGFPFGRAWREYGHVHPLGDDWSITLAGNMATMPVDRVLDLCRQVPREMVQNVFPRRALSGRTCATRVLDGALANFVPLPRR